MCISGLGGSLLVYLVLTIVLVALNSAINMNKKITCFKRNKLDKFKPSTNMPIVIVWLISTFIVSKDLFTEMFLKTLSYSESSNIYLCSMALIISCIILYVYLKNIKKGLSEIRRKAND